MTRPKVPVVLLVDDHADTLTMYAEMLRFSGFDVLQAADGAEALALGADTRPSIVVTDLRMPGRVSAEEICRHFAATGIPVIAVTASVKTREHDAIRAAGCGVVLLKPLTPDRLISEIRRALPHGGPVV